MKFVSLVSDSGLYLEYKKDFNAEFQERVRERSSGQGHHDGISAFRRYKRTTPFVLGLNVRMGKNHWLT